jgi:hypothetical protein
MIFNIYLKTQPVPSKRISITLNLSKKPINPVKNFFSQSKKT